MNTKCIVCDKEANTNKKGKPGHYDMVIQMENKTFYLHNLCFVKLTDRLTRIFVN